MSRYNNRHTYFVPTPKRCKECGRTLKNKKKYKFIGKVIIHGKYWTLKKVCKACGHVNVAEHGN